MVLKRENVLFLIHDLARGGAERVFVNYVNNLRSIRPLVVLVRPRMQLAGELNRIIPVFDLDPADLDRGEIVGSYRSPPQSGPAPVALARKALRLARLANATGSGVVSTFLHKSHLIALTAKLLLDRRLRVVVNVHEVLSQHAPHHFTPAQQVVMGTLTRALFPLADRIVAVADAVKTDLVRKYGIAAAKIAVAHNPLDLEAIRSGAEEADPAPRGFAGPLLVAVGRLEPLKGFDLLIDALGRLSPGCDARLVVVGEGSARHELEARALRQGLSGAIRFVGEQANPWRFLARADLLVLPSRTEAFPNVIGEAFALGIPVVASECSAGVREYLQDGSCGVLVPPEDPGALAAGIESLWNDTARRQQLRRRGLARVEAFALAAAVDRYEGILRTVFDRTPSAA